MTRNMCRVPALAAVALLGLALSPPADAAVSPRAAAEAREHGFNAADALGPDVSLVERGRGRGLFKVRLGDGQEVTTHGPDERHEVEDHGTSLGSGDPERPPVCADSGYQHVLYGAPANEASRYPDVVPQIRSTIRRMNALLNAESRESGGPQGDYRVLCDDAGEIRVDTFTAPAGAKSFRDVASAAQAAGFDRAATKYTIFYETDASQVGYCGVGAYFDDERLSSDNLANTSRAYGISHDGCWGGRTPLHENAHNMGAVLPDAPNSTGTGGHCNQDLDVMCYVDGGDRNQTMVGACLDRLHFDCGGDDYFDTTPEQGEYLATHWNLGSPLNRFLAFSAASNGSPIATHDGATVEKDSPRALYVLGNDSDPDGDSLRVASAADPAHGSAAVAADGQSVRYTPDPGYVGPDSFTYLVSDGKGAESSARVSITVRDTIAPRVRAVSPVHLARGISPSASVSATFSERMSSSTLNGTTVKLVRRGTTQAVRATVRYDAVRQRVVLDPSRALVRGATYAAGVTRGARDLAGNRLYAATTWRFTVRR